MLNILIEGIINTKLVCVLYVMNMNVSLELKPYIHWTRNKTYEGLYDGEKLYPLLVQQYHVSGLPGILLSPTPGRNGDVFECCSQCFPVLKPSNAENTKKLAVYYFVVPFYSPFPFLFPFYLTLI